MCVCVCLPSQGETFANILTWPWNQGGKTPSFSRLHRFLSVGDLGIQDLCASVQLCLGWEASVTNAPCAQWESVFCRPWWEGFSPPGVGTTGGCHPSLPPKEYVVPCPAKGEAKTGHVAQCVEFLFSHT